MDAPTEARKTNPEILISSSSLDRASWQPVAENLTARGYEVFVYESDKVAFGKIPLAITIDSDGLRVLYDDKEFLPGNFAAAWRRRPNMFVPDQEDWTRQFQIDEERKQMQSVLWSAVPERAWLNLPKSMRQAEDKATQLLIANEAGFNIPKTVITNKWDVIDDRLPADIVLKMHLGVIYNKEGIEALYTTRFLNSSEELPLENSPFPGFWQPYITKEREWRITVVGDRFFDAVILTDDQAKDDWRRPENAGHVRYSSEPFPDEEKEKCLKFLGHYGLKFGAFDFIEDNDGKITFLECNTNGQFMWLEQKLGMPITAAIADELVKIAESNTKN